MKCIFKKIKIFLCRERKKENQIERKNLFLNEIFNMCVDYYVKKQSKTKFIKFYVIN